MTDKLQSDTTDTLELVRARLEAGRPIADHDIHALVHEVDRLRTIVALANRIHVGDLTLSRGWDAGKIHIERDNGEAGDFDGKEFRDAVLRFFSERF